MADIVSSIVSPFADYAFMRRALVACFALALGGTPLGIFMVLRRMTLMGDAVSHAILPGVAVAFVMFGLSTLHMTVGGIAAGVIIALLVLAMRRYTKLKDDATVAMFYLLSLAAGVVIISAKGGSVDLLHFLFGNILAIDDAALYLVSGISCVSLFVIAAFYRSLVIECFDPEFAEAANPGKNYINQIFFVLLVINLVASFQALGTLMALGLMILPAIAAKFWTNNIDGAVGLAVLFAVLSAPIGLLLSYYYSIPAGPAVVLTAGLFSLASALLGKHGSVRASFFSV